MRSNSDRWFTAGRRGRGSCSARIAAFLIVEDPLRPAAAIVPLGGQPPFREMEAAKLYHAGLAPVVVVVPTAFTQQTIAFQQLGIKKVPEWELSRQVLIQQGVPASAILIPQDEGIGTLEELQAAYEAVMREAQRCALSGVGCSPLASVPGHPSLSLR